ncbi:MAG: hypothetical protein ACKVQS_01300 [Fimbriimonadaceae bacterium]
MKLTRLFSVLALAASTISMVLAQPVTYSTGTVPIKAGVVLLRNSANFIIPSGAPHIWGILDGDQSIKPADWRFQSGTGNGVLSTGAATRFGGTAGSPMNKTFAPYWEVDIRTASAADVLKFDVLQVSLVGNAVLTTADRELLRQFVDKGGLLWIDFADNAASVDGVNNFPAPVVARNAPAGPGSFIQVNPFHPLILGPNQLSLADIYSMTNGASTQVLDPFALGASPVAAILGGAERDSLRIESVATSDNSAVIAVSQVGDGFILMTSRSMSRIINRDSSGGANAGLILSPPRRDAAYTAAAKLVMNALSLRSRYASAAAGSRNSSSTGVTIGVPAIKEFAAPAFPGTKGRPILANGRMIVASGGTLYVYDADPGSDVDRDGNSDDGIADPVGSSYDRVWSSTNLGTISEPTYVEVPGAPFAEQVWVQSADGRVHGFNLNQTGTFTNVAPFASIDPPGTSPATQPKLFAPTAHEGILYVADAAGATANSGRLWMVNLRMAADIANLGGTVNEARNVDDDGIVVGNYAWGNSTGTTRFGPPAGSASIAYIPIPDSSGGMDLIAYVGTQRQLAPSAAAAGLTSIYLGARGEIPTNLRISGTGINMTTRAATNALRLVTITGNRSPKGLTVRVFINGQVLSAAQMATYFTGVVLQPSVGEIQLQIQPAQLGAFDWDGTATPGNTLDDPSYRVDYVVDWTAGVNAADGLVRGHLQFMDQPTQELDMVTAPAIAPSGNVGVILSGPRGGSFYNILESGQGGFLVRGRFEFHSAISNLGALGSAVGYPSSLVDEDDLVRLVPPINAAMSVIRPTGIAASGNSFIVTTNAVKNLGPFSIPTAAILSFEAAPEDSEFTIDLGTNQGVTSIKQPDMAQSGYSANPAIFSFINSAAFTIEPIPNSTRARVRMRSLAGNLSPNGNMAGCLANNLPVIINRNGQTDTIYEPEAPSNNGVFFRGFASGRWNQLNWYTVLNGYNAQVGPVIAGDRIIVGGASLFPSLIVNGFGPPSGFDGLLYGMDRTISPDDTHLVSTAARPWVSQLYSLKVNGPVTPFNFNNVSSAKSIRWPQLNGITDIDDLRVRVLQASILGESQFFGLAAGEGSIAITGDDNTTLFKRSDFVLADAGRLSRFDPSGNPLWSIESTGEIGTNQPNIAERARPLSSPNRIYPDGSNGYVFVDPGNNLVARMDAAGREVRSITKVRFHEDVFATTDPARPEQSPRGQSPNEAKLLRNPQDVAFWTTYVTAADVQRLFPSEVGYRTYTNEKWDNWLIADAGNNRVVQLIDRYMLDANGRVTGVVRYVDRTDNEDPNNLTPALGILWWHSPEEFTGKRYAYNSIGRTTIDVGGTPRTAYALGFNNIQPSLKTFGLDTTPGAKGDNSGGYGGAIIYDGPQTKVINEIVVPASPANVLMGTTGANFAFNLPARAAQTIKVSGLTSATVKYNDFGGGPILTVMLSTNRGVYEVIEVDPGGGLPKYWQVIWQLPVEVYEFIRRPVGVFASYTLGQLGDNPQGFRPMHARRLDSGDVLIVNGYSGTKKDSSQFDGEVLIIDGSAGIPADARIPSYDVSRENFGFNSLSVKFELPPVQGIRGIFRPVFAERQ